MSLKQIIIKIRNISKTTTRPNSRQQITQRESPAPGGGPPK